MASTPALRGGYRDRRQEPSAQIVDVDRFRTEIAAALRLGKLGDLAAATEAFERAVVLYRGALLEDEPGAAWARAERGELERLFIAALTGAAIGNLSAAQHQRAGELARRTLLLDPGTEDASRFAMAASHALGRSD